LSALNAYVLVILALLLKATNLDTHSINQIAGYHSADVHQGTPTPVVDWLALAAEKKGQA